MRPLILLAASLALGLGSAGTAHAQSGNGTVIAIVNGDEILGSHMSMFYESLPAQYQQVPMETLYAQLLEGLIDRKLLAQAARGAGLLDDTTVKQRLAYIEDNVLQRAYLDRIIEDELTDERLRAAYDGMIATMAPKEEVHARHILLGSEEEAKAVIAELEAGADFATLARQRSTGPSGPNGGDLGYFTREQMVPEFAAAAFALSPGEITTEPVQTQFGWHVIKVEDRRTAAMPSFEESLPDLRSQEAQNVIVAVMQRLRESAVISRFDAQGNPVEAPTPPAGDGAE